MDFLTLGILGIFFLLFWWYVLVRPPAGMPPGPPRLPLIGSLPFLSQKDPLGQLLDYRKKYGPVFTIYLANRPVVYLNTFDTMWEALVDNKDNFAERYTDFAPEAMAYSGVNSFTGATAEENHKIRRFTQKCLVRDFGMGRTVIEENINAELIRLVEYVDSTDGKPTDLFWPMTTCTSNVVNLILIGNRFEKDDNTFKAQVKGLEDVLQYVPTIQILLVFPWLKYVPGDPLGYKEYRKMISKRWAFWTNLVKENKSSSNDTFVTRWIQQSDDFFTELRLALVCSNLFDGGVETTKGVIYIIVAYLLHFPDIQQKIHKLIDDNVGRDRPPTLKDRENLRYIQAVIYEALRLKPTVPLSVPHANAQAATIAGHTIPAGTMIMPNIYGVNHDPKVWKDPEVFDPSRFIDADGSLIHTNKVASFSMGARVCPGEAMARMEMFLMLTTLLQHYKFVLPQGHKLPSLNNFIGLTLSIDRYKVCAQKRTLT